MYWQQETNVFDHAAADLLRRNRFEDIVRYDYLPENAKLTSSDKLTKV